MYPSSGRVKFSVEAYHPMQSYSHDRILIADVGAAMRKERFTSGCVESVPSGVLRFKKMWELSLASSMEIPLLPADPLKMDVLSARIYKACHHRQVRRQSSFVVCARRNGI